MLDRNAPKKDSGIYALDAWLRRTAKSLFKPGPGGRVRVLAVVVLLSGIVAGGYAAPYWWNKGADAVNAPFLKFGLAPYRLGLDLQGGTSLTYQADVSRIPDNERRDALEGVRDVVERRVNAFGVSEPLVQTSIANGNYRIIAELAGIKDVNEAIRQIGETPILEFKEQSDKPARELTEQEKKDLAKYNADALAKANDLAKQALASAASTTAFADLAATASEDPSAKTNRGDLGFFSRDAMVKSFADAAFDKLAVGEITKEPVQSEFGWHVIKKTGEREIDKDGKKVKEVSASHILIRTRTERDVVPLEEWKGTGLTGKQLKRASVQFDPQSGEPTVALQFNDEGAKLFGEITERNVDKPVAIFLDGAVISAPRVVQKITGGQAVITGRFTVAEAKKLVQRLNAGALPVPVTLLTQRTVGATLGEASLAKSLTAGLIGFLAVAVFMLAFYRFPGVLASVALVIYTALSLAVFKRLNVTMTLAGIAGFILSIGMAVDANVLIFERLKEEIRRGRTVGAAVDEGFRRAWNSIRDSNVSSLITCAILYWFGSSAVRGFAVTLAIGIAISMFSAITVTRSFIKLTMGSWAEKHLWLFGAKRMEHET